MLNDVFVKPYLGTVVMLGTSILMTAAEKLLVGILI